MNMSTTALSPLTPCFPRPVAREGWAGEQGPAVVRATQARVAQAARVIVEASPAAHTTGGRPPGGPTIGPPAGRSGIDQGGVGREGAEMEGVGL